MSARRRTVSWHFGRNAPPAICLTAALLGLLACAEPADQGGDPSNALTVLYGGDEHVLGLPYAMSARFLVFLPLATRNANGQLEGRLARSWEHSPDYRVWTVRLRSDVRWHDGVPVTAHDVEFTLDLLKHPSVLYAYAEPEAYEVRVVDDTTYTITLRKGRILSATMGTPLDTWTVYAPRHLLKGLDPARWTEWEFWKAPVGNGPYRYVRHVPGSLIELEANPDFYRGRPRIDRVALKLGGGVPLVELLSGNVDVTGGTEVDVLKVADDPRFRVYQGFASTVVRAIAWNHRRPALRDPRVRRALTLAIDRRELLRLQGLPEETPLFDVLYTVEQFRCREIPPALPYDPAEAGRLLEEAGWRDTDGDGIREREGNPLQFSILVGRARGQEEAAVYIQSLLRPVGVRVEVERVGGEGTSPRVKAGNFDAVILHMPLSGEWAGRSFFEGDSPSGYANPRVRSLLGEARETWDPAARDRIFRQLWPIFQADLPVTFLHPLVQRTIAHRRVRGLSSPYRTDPVAHMEELWLEEGG